MISTSTALLCITNLSPTTFFTSNLIKINTSLSTVYMVLYELLYQCKYQIVIIHRPNDICSNIIVYTSKIKKKKG